jgi:hypothetical protein
MIFTPIPYTKKHECEEILKEMKDLEHDITTLNSIMKEYQSIVETHDSPIIHIDDELKQTYTIIDESNITLNESTEIHKSHFGFGIASTIIIGINTPIGILLGTKVVIGTVIASTVLTAMFSLKK